MELFDGIFKEWGDADIDPGALTVYLNKIWQARPLFLSEEDDEDEIRSRDQRFCTLNQEGIKPKNYVGFIQFEGHRINIYPRVFYKHTAFTSKLAIQHLLKWLSYCSRINFPFSLTSFEHDVTDDWLEALIFLFTNFAEETLSASPYFNYQEELEDMAFVRGSIAIPQYIQQNLAKGRHHAIHCRYEPFVYDNLFNRIVKYTCRFLSQITKTATNKKLLGNIIFLLDDVQDCYCTFTDCQKVVVNRLRPEIAIVRDMCGTFLQNRSFNDHNEGNNNLCMLLPMEIIFEQYIAGFLKRMKPEVQPQASDAWLAEIDENSNDEIFRMKHDILIPDKMIIDTKYKFRENRNDGKEGVNQSDIYQVVSYAYRRQLNNAMLLYPKHFGHDASEVEMKLKIYNGDKRVKECKSILVDVKSIDITESEFDNFDQGQRKKFEDTFSI